MSAMKQLVWFSYWIRRADLSQCYHHGQPEQASMRGQNWRLILGGKIIPP
jgi:hypothetical protein